MNDAAARCGDCAHYLALYYRLREEPPSYAPAGCGLCPLTETTHAPDQPGCPHFCVRGRA